MKKCEQLGHAVETTRRIHRSRRSRRRRRSEKLSHGTKVSSLLFIALINCLCLLLSEHTHNYITDSDVSLPLLFNDDSKRRRRF